METHANAIQTILDKNYISIYGGSLDLTSHSFWHHFLIFLKILPRKGMSAEGAQTGGGRLRLALKSIIIVILRDFELF